MPVSPTPNPNGHCGTHRRRSRVGALLAAPCRNAASTGGGTLTVLSQHDHPENQTPLPIPWERGRLARPAAAVAAGAPPGLAALPKQFRILSKTARHLLACALLLSLALAACGGGPAAPRAPPVRRRPGPPRPPPRGLEPAPPPREARPRRQRGSRGRLRRVGRPRG